MDTKAQNIDAKAQQLRSLHQGPAILALPNAWDVASARIFENAGFAAIGTSSAGVAFSLGYQDGQNISRDEMIAVIARITKALKIPVTADVEGGYGDPAETARRVWAAGAVGMNLEDSPGGQVLNDLDDQKAQIRAIRKAVPGMVINARTDIFLNSIGEEAARTEATIARLNAFLDAGADCVFAPGVRDLPAITALAQAIHGPLNILAVVGSPSLAEMSAAGVRRVSLGSGPMRATLGLIDRIAHELKETGTYKAMTESAILYSDVNKMFV